MAAGDVNVNALTPITSEPTTTDSLVAVNRNTNEGQIIDYNLLADKILSKLTSKTYSGLSTTSKLLVGAINELDSDVTSLNSRADSYVIAKETDWQEVTSVNHVSVNNAAPTGYTFLAHVGLIASGFVCGYILSNSNNNTVIWFDKTVTGTFKLVSLFRRT